MLTKEQQKDLEDLQHDLRCGNKDFKFYNTPKFASTVIFSAPTGVFIDELAGVGWVLKMKGLLNVESIVKSDKFCAQGLEGKLSFLVPYQTALIYAQQVPNYRFQIKKLRK